MNSWRQILSSKEPYIKKVEDIDNISVWIVDGDYIRNNLDEEFSNCGEHYSYQFIPTNEFWIDKNNSNDSEIPFFVDHLLVMHRNMKEGKSYDKSLELADRKELSERKKSGLVPIEPKKEKVADVRESLLKELPNGLKILPITLLQLCGTTNTSP